jgi:hypothetical protein
MASLPKHLEIGCDVGPDMCSMIDLLCQLLSVHNIQKLVVRNRVNPATSNQPLCRLSFASDRLADYGGKLSTVELVTS